jgi:hypothetical protein
MISTEEIFNVPILMAHLARMGVESVLAPQAAHNDVLFALMVWSRESPRDLRKHGNTLLKVLKTYYPFHKGIPIHWTLR